MSGDSAHVIFRASSQPALRKCTILKSRRLLGSVSAKTRRKGEFPGSAGSGLLLCLKSHPKRRRELGDRPLQATGILGSNKPTGQLEGSPYLTSAAWNTLPGSGYCPRVPIPFTGCFSPTQPGVWGLLGPHSALVAFFLCCPWQAYPSPWSGGHPHARVPIEPHPAPLSQLQAMSFMHVLSDPFQSPTFKSEPSRCPQTSSLLRSRPFLPQLGMCSEPSSFLPPFLPPLSFLFLSLSHLSAPSSLCLSFVFSLLTLSSLLLHTFLPSLPSTLYSSSFLPSPPPASSSPALLSCPFPTFPIPPCLPLIPLPHGNPLQYSCLENPRDRGAWRAAVHRVAQSRTRLKRLSSSSSTPSYPLSALAQPAHASSPMLLCPTLTTVLSVIFRVGTCPDLSGLS